MLLDLPFINLNFLLLFNQMLHIQKRFKWSSSLQKAELLLSKTPIKLSSTRLTLDNLVKDFFYTPKLLRSMSTTTAAPKEKLSLKTIDGSDIAFISSNIPRLIRSNHPLLNTVSKYYFSKEGKKLRPLLVLLMAKAVGEVSEKQKTLAMITELIHTASLMHDDVIDEAAIRRSMPSIQVEFGNKLAILGGDFLLSRASVALARLRNCDVVELLAEVIGDLVEGEVMQMQSESAALDLMPVGWKGTLPQNEWLIDQFQVYLNKSYLKTASLIAKSCQASLMLSESSLHPKAFEFGRALGIAFQLIDDCLDFSSSSVIGKPSNYDLELGLATAPVLFASESFSELKPMIERRFSGSIDGRKDSNVAYEMVGRTNALAKTRELSGWFVGKALESLSAFPSSPEKQMLNQIAQDIVTRSR